MTKPSPPSEWLNSKEAARYLGISVILLRKLVLNEEVVSYKISQSRRRRFRPEDLEKLFKPSFIKSEEGGSSPTDLASFIAEQTRRP